MVSRVSVSSWKSLSVFGEFGTGCCVSLRIDAGLLQRCKAYYEPQR